MRAPPPHVWLCARSIYMLMPMALLASRYINTCSAFEVNLEMSQGLGYSWVGQWSQQNILGWRSAVAPARIFSSEWGEYSTVSSPPCRLDCPIWSDQTIKLNISQIEAKTSSGIKPLEGRHQKQIRWIQSRFITVCLFTV